MVSSTSQPLNMWDPVKNLKLKRVLGSTISGRFSLIQQPKTSNLIYIAGCVVVILDTELKSQRHLFTTSKQSLTTLSITSDGQFLAAASCSSQQANIYVWDIKALALVSEWKTNNCAIACMSFSNNGRILVLAGDQRDPSLSVWDWRRQWKLSSSSVDTKIRAIAFAHDDRHFVTVGHAHVMYWQILFPNNSDTTALVTCGGPANLGEQKKNSFCDVKCGQGPASSSFFCITNTGLLCEINESRLLHKWVDLRVASANCLAVSDDTIAIGCSNGIVRCFSSQQLRFLRNLPKPFNSELQRQHNKPASAVPQQSPRSSYPEVSSIVLNHSTGSLSCQYADKSLYVWDLSESTPVKSLKYCGLYHSSCIWGLDTYPSCSQGSNRSLPENSFITCSSDDSIRIWNPSVFDAQPPADKNDSFRSRALPSNELLQVIFTQDDLNGKTSFDSSTLDSTKVNDSYDNNYGLRCLRIAPDGGQLAIGSRSGVIKVYNLERDEEVKNIAAHDAEVLCLEYSDPKTTQDAHFYLASSSRDKLIHIFDASDNYNFLQTIDDHSSSITALKFFTTNNTHNSLQLISCGADFKIIIRNGLLVNGQLSFIRYHQIEGKSTFYDMALVNNLSCIITGCQDSMVRLYDISHAEYLTGFGGLGAETGPIIKLALDPSSTFLATSYTDKSIRIYDYQRAACIAFIDHGLSDLVTDMKFTQNGNHLVACSGDGCIFIWELPVQISSVINGKMSSLPHNSRTIEELMNVKTVIPTTEASIYTSMTCPSSDYETSHFPKGTNKNHIIEQASDNYSDNKSSTDNENLYAEINQPERGYKVYNVELSRPGDTTEEDYMNLRFSNSMDFNGRTPPSLGTRYATLKDDSSSRAGFHEKSELLKSRDSLDLITRRQRYVSDNLMHNKTASKKTSDTSASQSKKAHPSQQSNHYQSLKSARSYVSQSNDDFRNMTFADQTGQTFNYDSQSRLSTSQMGRAEGKSKQQGRQLERMSSSGLSKSINLMETRAAKNPVVPSSDEEEDDCSSDYDNNRLLVNASTSRQRSVTPPKPSQHRQFRRNSSNNTSSSLRNEDSITQTASPALIEASKNNDSSLLSTEQQQLVKVSGESTGRLGPQQLKPGEAPSADHCKSVAQELQIMSRYASELYHILLRSDRADPALCNLIETAAQSSIAVLSGILLKNSDQLDNDELENSWKTTGQDAAGQHQMARQRRHGGQHQLLVSPPPPSQQHEFMMHSKKAAGIHGQKTSASNGSPGVEKYQQPPPDGGKKASRGGADLANLDKVLEDYSNRLVQMVQERMIESAVAPTSANTYERLNNNERLGQ